MRIYATVSIAALALIAGSCADAPTQPSPGAVSQGQSPSLERAPRSAQTDLLQKLPVTGPLMDDDGTVVGAFIGTLSITSLGFDVANRTYTVTGLLSGRAMKLDGGILKTSDGRPAVIPAGKPITITDIPVSLGGGDGASSALVRPTQAVCDILLLDLAPIHLDLLGLVLDTSQITIDLSAQSGSGKLLGNLLCALLGILDPIALLQVVTQLLESINNILAGLGGGPPAA